MMANLKPQTLLPNADRLAVTLLIAAALHAIIILGITFTPEDRDPADDLPTLEITVARKQSNPVEEADYLAESSQEGAGNTTDKVRPQEERQQSSPPPASRPVEPQPAATPIITAQETKRPIPEPTEKTQTEPKPLSATEVMSRSMEMLSLNQEINQSLQAYAQRPKEKFISASTREFKYANYMNDWVNKVERVGDLNYPDEARRRALSGSLRVDVTLNADGTVRDINITKPSPHKLLNDAAVRIVRLAAPYPPFPQEIREEVDILHITRTWEFTSGNQLHSR